MAIFATQSEASLMVDTSPLLSSMRELSSGMTVDEREIVARQLVTLLQDYYVHLPLKRSSLGTDPVQEARLLVDDVRFLQSDEDFFRRIFDILKRLRDRHTALRLPSPQRDMVAYLPFAVESYFDATGRHLIVTKIMSDVGEPSFEAGVEISHWNGTSIRRFIENLSWDSEGANPFSRIATTMRSLTVRPLGYMLAPREDWVTLTYLTTSGLFRNIVIPWRVYIPAATSAAGAANVTASGGVALLKGVDRSTLIVNNTWYDLFSQRGSGAGVAPSVSDTVRFKTVRSSFGGFGYIRIFSFDAPDPAAFVDGFAAILRQVPQTGVIIDIRSNPGGTIPAGEGLFALFSNRTTTPEPVSFRNTAATRRLGILPQFRQWRRSFEMQLETGEVFTQGFSLTAREPVVRGIYAGKVVLIIDALCYSTTDFFVAGMQDNGLAKVIGIDPVTGAGGGNVWSQSLLSQFTTQSGGTDLVALPSNIDIDIAVRRSLRVGPNEGIPVEGLGVFADHIYTLTRRDVLGENEDLIEFACRVLAG